MAWETLDFTVTNFNTDVSSSLLPDATCDAITNVDFFAGFPRTLNKLESVTTPLTKVATMTSYVGDGLVYLGYAGPGGVWAWGPDNIHHPISPATGLTGNPTWDSDSFGEYGIFTNGKAPEVPHAINASTTQTGGKLAPLPGWNNPDAGGVATPVRTANLIRQHRNVLWAANLVENGVTYSNRVRWSTSSITDALPSSWGVQPGNDAGRVDLEFVGGNIVDMCAVGDVMFIGASGGVWAAHWIGGAYVYKFSQLSTAGGPRGPKCMASLGDIAAMLTLTDLIVFDESSERSIATNRIVSLIGTFTSAQLLWIGTTRQLYIFYALRDEPEGLHHALIWDRDSDTFGRRDFSLPNLGFTDTSAVIIPVVAPDVAWDASAQTWDVAYQPWNTAQTTTKAYAGGSDVGIYTSSATPQPWLISRSQMPAPDGDNIRVRSIEADIQGVSPQTVYCRIGHSESLGQPITWEQERGYEITSGVIRHDSLCSGRYISWQIRGTGASRLNMFRLYYLVKSKKP